MTYTARTLIPPLKQGSMKIELGRRKAEGLKLRKSVSH
jgi:hypothetical protein